MDRNIPPTPTSQTSSVALRKESVDRNGGADCSEYLKVTVALRKESVDRNFYAVQVIIVVVGRSPQGERG